MCTFGISKSVDATEIDAKSCLRQSNGLFASGINNIGDAVVVIASIYAIELSYLFRCVPLILSSRRFARIYVAVIVFRYIYYGSFAVDLILGGKYVKRCCSVPNICSVDK